MARAQHLRHVIANTLTLPLTVLRELHEGRTVEPRALAQAIRDLDALLAWVDTQPPSKPSGGEHRERLD